MAVNNQVIVDGEARQLSSQYEDDAAAEVFTGALLEETANGVQHHATAGGHADRVLVALDDRGRGMELGDSYPAGDNVKYRSLSGGRVHLRLAAGEAATANLTRLVSDGAGGVRAIDQDGTAPDDPDTATVAVAKETVDNTAGTGYVYVAAEVVA